MWICPKCKAEVDEGFEICWSCGASPDGFEDAGFDPEFDGVLDEKAFRAVQEARRHEDLVTVASFWSAGEAYVTRSRLEAAGIHAYLADETMMGGLLSNAVGGIKVEVAEKDLHRAQRVLADRSHHEIAGAGEEE